MNYNHSAVDSGLVDRNVIQVLASSGPYAAQGFYRNASEFSSEKGANRCVLSVQRGRE